MFETGPFETGKRFSVCRIIRPKIHTIGFDFNLSDTAYILKSNIDNFRSADDPLLRNFILVFNRIIGSANQLSVF